MPCWIHQFPFEYWRYATVGQDITRLKGHSATAAVAADRMSSYIDAAKRLADWAESRPYHWCKFVIQVAVSGRAYLREIINITEKQKNIQACQILTKSHQLETSPNMPIW